MDSPYWQIPDYDLRHYLAHKEDKDKILQLKTCHIGDDVEVSVGLKFPGFHGINNDYQTFYKDQLLNVHTAPRGNLVGDKMICGIAPGESQYSFGEPKWLLGPSSKILHQLLNECNIYPYFTNIFKKPFPKNIVKYEWPTMRVMIQWFTKEVEIVKPKLVIFLGKYPEYGIVHGQLFLRKIKFIQIAHPSAISRYGGYDEWKNDFKVKMENIDECIKN
jgi:uracil-DNA glycosylase family 4